MKYRTPTYDQSIPPTYDQTYFDTFQMIGFCGVYMSKDIWLVAYFTQENQRNVDTRYQPNLQPVECENSGMYSIDHLFLVQILSPRAWFCFFDFV
jgi:hypothetical protein